MTVLLSFIVKGTRKKRVPKDMMGQEGFVYILFCFSFACVRLEDTYEGRWV